VNRLASGPSWEHGALLKMVGGRTYENYDETMAAVVADARRREEEVAPYRRSNVLSYIGRELEFGLSDSPTPNALDAAFLAARDEAVAELGPRSFAAGHVSSLTDVPMGSSVLSSLTSQAGDPQRPRLHDALVGAFMESAEDFLTAMDEDGGPVDPYDAHHDR
jgi:hypothetical protein